MATVRASRLIKAPVEKVFRTIAHIEEFEKASPSIEKVEFLSDNKSGLGARFRETRAMNGRQASSVLEVTEYEENRRVRFLSDEGGVIWDTMFTTAEEVAGSALLMEMEARPHKLFARLMTPIIMGMVRKAIEGDMDAVKEYCETHS
ncbi:MAG: SRPBCC family protein [Pseudomonadota bacterium]